MDQRGKRLLIIALVVILLFLGVTGYFLFFAKKNSVAPTTGIDPNLFPFDQQSNQIKDLPVVTNGETQSGTTDEIKPLPDSEAVQRPRLRKITNFPVSGFVSFTTPDVATETILDPKTNTEKQVSTPVNIHRVRYGDQRTGHIFEGVINETSILNRKITKTDLPTGEEFVFNKTGTRGILRYEKNRTIGSFQVELPTFEKEVPKYCKIIFKTDLKIGMRNAEVKKLQAYLHEKYGKNIKIDGIFLTQTRGFVQEIQHEFSLNETGVFDEPTRIAISTECETLKQPISKTSEEPYELKGSLVDGLITQIVKNNTDNTVFLIKKTNGKSVGLLKNFNDNTTTPVFSSSFNEWMPQFVNKTLITMTTYASHAFGGYMYDLDPITQKFTKVLGPSFGLTTLTSPDGKYVLVSNIENNQLVTKVVDLNTRTQKILPFTTLSEKCVWYDNSQLFCGVPNTLPQGQYPDDWYKGVVSFKDTLWLYNIADNRAVSVITPNETVDMFRMESFITPEYIFFMNKNNYELWSYRVGGTE
jgi:hypothetical protein